MLFMRDMNFLVSIISNIVFVFIIIKPAVTSVNDLLFTDNPYVVIGYYGQHIKLSFYTNFTNGDKRTARYFSYELNGTTIASGVGQNFRESSQIPSVLTERINTSYDSQLQSYNLNIYNLTFKDSHTLSVILFYFNTNNELSSHILKQLIDVKGGPLICGNHSTTSTYISFNDHTTNRTSVTLCGNPKPRLTWYIDDIEVSQDIVNEYEIDQHSYTYDIMIDLRMCGKTLSYVATGYSADIKETFNITTNIEPPSVELTNVTSIGLCTSAKWTLADIGNCTGIEYQIEYLLGVNNTAFVDTVSMTTDNHSYCVNDTSLFNITMVRLRSIYNQKVSMWKQQNVIVHKEVNRDIIYAAESNIIGHYGSSYQISLFTNFIDNDNRTPKQLFYELNNTQIASGVTHDFRVTSRVPATLKSRLTASYDSKLESYNLNIHNLSFEDTYTFSAVLFYIIDNDNTKPASATIQINTQVHGGPIVSGDKLSNNITLASNQTNHNTSIMLCGNPKPLVKWFLEDEIISSLDKVVSSFKYIYTVTLTSISADMCGKNLSYVASGVGEDIYGFTTIFVSFDPPPVKLTDSYSSGLFTNVQWEPIDIGNCKGLQYQIEYMHHDNESIFVDIVSMETTNHSYCVNDSSSFNIAMVRIRSIYQGKFGEWTYMNVTLPKHFIENPDIIYSNLDSIFGIYEEHIEIIFFSNFTVEETPKQFSFELNKTSIASGIKEDFRETNEFPTNLKPRLSTFYDSESKSYNLRVNNTQFEDEFTFTFNVLYTINNDNNRPRYVSKNVTTFVLGSPFICGKSLPSTTIFTENTTNSLTITLCGNPKPTVSWYIDEKLPSGNVSYLNESITPYKHAYTISILTVTPSICGKVLRYEAHGYGNATLKESSTILVNFDPPTVHLTEAYNDMLCTYTTWTLVDIGTCTGIEYQIEYLLGVNNTAFVSTVSITTDNHLYCVNDTALYNITMVRLRSVYQHKHGEWSYKDVDYNTGLTTIPISTTKTTTTTLLSTSTPSPDDDGDNDMIIIAASAGGGGAFIIIIILIICCLCCCKKKMKKSTIALQNHSIVEYDVGTKKENIYGIENQIMSDNSNPATDGIEIPRLSTKINSDNVMYVSGVSYTEPVSKAVKLNDANAGNKSVKKTISYRASNDGYASDEFETYPEDEKVEAEEEEPTYANYSSTEGLYENYNSQYTTHI